MRVRSIRLRNFKRFTDLEIANIPAGARLVVVVGPNGSGKSSLFDGFLQFYRGQAGWGWNGDEAYTRKDRTAQYAVQESATVTLHSGGGMQRSSLYVRSAYRSEPEFMVGQIQRTETPSEQLRVGQMNQADSVSTRIWVE
jgi:ABC-type cobalamin/Fe3+-siderophores transport system ATPase subunit